MTPTTTTPTPILPPVPAEPDNAAILAAVRSLASQVAAFQTASQANHNGIVATLARHDELLQGIRNNLGNTP